MQGYKHYAWHLKGPHKGPYVENNSILENILVQ